MEIGRFIAIAIAAFVWWVVVGILSSFVVSGMILIVLAFIEYFWWLVLIMVLYLVARRLIN